VNNSEQTSDNHSFGDAGETGKLVLDYDWASSSLGPIAEWPQSLRTTLDIVLHSAFPMFLFWGPDLICFYNDAYRPSLGAEGRHPAIGRKASDVWPDIWDAIHPIILKVLNTGQPAWFEDRLIPIFRNNNLENVYWTFSYSAAYDNGKISGVVVTCMETTAAVMNRSRIERIVTDRTNELTASHQTVQELNAFFQNIIDLSKEPLQVLKPVLRDGKVIDFVFKFTNSAYAAYADTTPEKLQNRNVGEVFPGYFNTSSFSSVAETFITGKANTWEIHYDVDGLDLYNRMSAVRMDEYVVVHFTDFTELKNLQLELLKKISELERSNKNLEEFAHAVSHDLKEPVRKIKMFLSRLKFELDIELGTRADVTMNKIDSATDRMGALIDDLLSFSRMSMIPFKKEPVKLANHIAQVLDDLELEIQHKNAEIILNELPTVNGYPRQLQQLFQNLIANALKYSRPEVRPIVTITSNEKTIGGESFYVVDIRDNGIGFEPRFAEKIFQLFTRLHAKDEYSGSGIGLSIVKKVIENHNGKITAESSPGQGSTFSVYLPR
jgi:signal transduction histidine kinase